MAELKTKPTDESVERFLDRVEDERKRADAYGLLELMGRAAGAEPRMWGDAIVGFGQYHYKYASGHEGDAPLTGFSPRKRNLTVYLNYGFERHRELLERLGNHSTGKSCLYIKRLSDVDLPTLEKLVELSVEETRAANPQSG